MNKSAGKMALSALAALAGLALFVFVALSGDDISRSVNGLCSGLGGALIGLGGAGLIIPLAMRAMTPEQRKEAERGERDERIIAIRIHAAQDSWYWTLIVLWVPFVAALVRGETFWMVLCPAVIVLHCALYLVNMYRWSKKL